MLSNFAVWYLRKRKKSVMIGYEIENGKVKSLNPSSLTYDNFFGDIDYRMCDGKRFIIPTGKFSIIRGSNNTL
jgi:hypothetical protein